MRPVLKIVVLVVSWLSTCAVVYRSGWTSGWLESSRECRESMERVSADMKRVLESSEIK